MSLELYGSFRSRAKRSLWAALEVAVDFKQIPYAWNDPVLKSEEFQKINPLGRIPAFKDGNRAFSESLAINLYLAKVYGAKAQPALYPTDREAEVLQWSFFAASDLDPWVVLFGDHTAWKPEEKRIRAFADLAGTALEQSLQHLETALKSSSYLIGECFTIADLNAASVLQSLVPLSYPFSIYPNVNNWLRTSLDRPAALAASKYP